MGRKARDLSGLRLAFATVLERDLPYGTPPRWHCRCDCGAQFTAFTGPIIRGVTRGCTRCVRMADGRTRRHTGQRFGTWTVVERIWPERQNLKRGVSRRQGSWLLRCDCGSEKVLSNSSIKNHNIGECLCTKRRPRRSYSAYKTWHAIQERCLNKRSISYSTYGGRGIAICDRWRGKDGFWNFLADMGERPEGLTIDRINVNGNYEPGNCRWADAKTQASNVRCSVTRTSSKLDEAIASVRSSNLEPTRESVIAMLERLRHDFCG